MRSLKSFGSWILSLLQKNVWFLLLLICSSLYVFHHRSSITQFKDFDIDNLIFVIWLLLLLLPLFSEMELFGIKLKKEVEKVKQEAKEDIKELKRDIQIISVANQFSNQIQLYTNVPLPSKEDIKEAKNELSKSINAESSLKTMMFAEGLLKSVTESSVYLFQVRLVIEDLMYKLAINCGYSGGKASFPQILDHLTRNEYLNSKIIENLKQVRAICNRGVHGEIVSDDYLNYVREAFPYLVSHLENALHESVSSYMSCKKCGYSGPSRNNYICPKCKNVEYAE